MNAKNFPPGITLVTRRVDGSWECERCRAPATAPWSEKNEGYHRLFSDQALCELKR